MKPYPPQTAARVLTRKVPTVQASASVLEVLNYLRQNAHTFETLSYIYVLANSGKLKGVVAIKSLLKAKDQQLVKNIMTPNPIAVHPYTDQEKAAILAIQHNIKAVPVVDKQNTFQGIIPTDKILDVLHQEHIEDILKLSGLDISYLKLSEEASAFTTTIRSRLPWLLLGLAGGTFASWVVSLFNEAINRHIALAFFIPVVVYMSGAIASQTHSIIIRSLLLTQRNLKNILLREMSIGVGLGILFAIILSTISLYWLGLKTIALILAITLIINSTLSTSISTLVPWYLSKLNKDPALAAGPFAIVIQDILSLIVYFTTASMIFKLI
jgi:magnesium transporter